MKGQADRMRGRGAGARHHEGRPAQSAMHGNLARRRVHHQLRDGERINPLLLLVIDEAKTVVQTGLSAGSGPDDASGAHRQRHVEGYRGLRNRLARRHHRKLRNPVETGNLPLLEVLERVEILDLGGDLLAQFLGRLRQRDRPDPADTLLEIVPIDGGRVPKRRDGAEAGDDDAVHITHDFLSTKFWINLTTSPTVSNSVRGLLVLAL